MQKIVIRETRPTYSGRLKRCNCTFSLTTKSIDFKIGVFQYSCIVYADIKLQDLIEYFVLQAI